VAGRASEPVWAWWQTETTLCELATHLNSNCQCSLQDSHHDTSADKQSIALYDAEHFPLLKVYLTDAMLIKLKFLLNAYRMNTDLFIMKTRIHIPILMGYKYLLFQNVLNFFSPKITYICKFLVVKGIVYMTYCIIFYSLLHHRQQKVVLLMIFGRYRVWISVDWDFCIFQKLLKLNAWATVSEKCRAHLDLPKFGPYWMHPTLLASLTCCSWWQTYFPLQLFHSMFMERLYRYIHTHSNLMNTSSI